MTLIASSPHEGTLSHQPQPHVKSPLRPSSAAPSKRGSERSNSPARPQPPPSSSSSSPASQEATALQNPAWAHRSHQTTLPCANRLLQRKWDVAAQRDHRRKVRTARASIDNEPPKKYSHLVSQARKRRDEYDYAAKLYSENKNLLRRIKRQISVPREFSPNRMVGHSSGAAAAAEREEMLSVHHRSTPSPTRHNQDTVALTMKRLEKGLNEPRKRALRVQVKKSNEVLLQRLEASAPHYDTESFTRERRRTLHYLENISRFPLKYVVEREAIDAAHQAASRDDDYNDGVSVVGTSDDDSLIELWEEVIGPVESEEEPDPPNSSVPPRWTPKSPLVPRVAKLAKLERTPAPPPPSPKPPSLPSESAKSVRLPFVPRVALLPPRHRNERAEALAKERAMAKVRRRMSSLFDFDDSADGSGGGGPFDEEIPGWEHVSGSQSWMGYRSTMKAGRRAARSAPQMEVTTGTREGFGRTTWSTTAKMVLIGDASVLAEEREFFIQQELPKLRTFFSERGLEMQLYDLTSTVSRKTLDDYDWLLDLCRGECDEINTVLFFDNRTYGHPQDFQRISNSLFVEIRKQLKRVHPATVGGSGDLSLVVASAYLKNEEVVPPSWQLNPRIENSEEIKSLLRLALVKMAKKKSIDPVVAINLLQSNMHKDIVQTVCANASSEKWNLSILIKADEIEAGELATNSFLKLLLQQLDNAFPERNKIKAQPGGAPSETAGKLRELAQSAFIKPLKGSCVESEMVLHSQMLRRAAVEHWARDHQCEQIMNFISRADSHSLPPFLVLGAPSMCKTALLGQVFVRLEQKYGVITSARPAPAARPSSAKSSFSAEVSASRPNTPAWSFPDGTLYMLDASPRKSVSRRGSSVPGPTPERPVIVARVIGVSPHSSTKTLLVRSMTHQILQAFGRTKAKWHQQGRAIESSAFFSPNNLDGWGDTAEHWLSPNGDDNILGRFKSALQLASSARPIIILIAHGERLSDPQFTQHQSLSSITITGPDKPTAPWLAWLLQDIPPFVRLVISANSRSPTAIVAQGIITRAAPEALEKAIKATGSEVPPSKSEIEAAVAANILEMGGLIAPVVRASVKNWLLIEGRKFTSEKIDALQAGFEAAESNSDSVVPGRMAKMLYDVMKQTKRDEWKNLQLPKTIEEAMDQTLENLEREIGREPIELLACLIAVSKHGLFVTELMDMVLNVQGAGAISRKDSQLLPLPSISSLAIFVAALHALNPWTQKQSIFGGELLAFDGAMDFKNAVFERYMAHSRDSSFVFRLRLAAYFENLMTRNDDSPSAGMPLAHLNRVQTELLFQLARCGQWSRLFKIVASLDFLLNLIVCKGPSGAVLELQDVISYGSTSSEITEPELTSLTQLSQWLSRLRYLLADLPPRLYRGLLEKLAQAESTGVGSDIKNDLKACQPTNEHLSTHHNWTPLTHSTSMIEAMKFTDYSSTSYIIPRNDPRIRKHPTTEHPILNFGIDFHTRPKATIVGIKENSELTPALQKRIHHNGVTFVAASCDGKIIATAGSRGVLRLFDSFTMSEIGTYTYVGGGSGRNTIQPSGNPALSPSTNCTPNVLPVMEISYLAFEPSKSKAGHLILSTVSANPSENRVLVWALELEQVISTISGKKAGASIPMVSVGLLCDRNGKTSSLAFGYSVAGVLAVWSVKRQTLLKSIKGDACDSTSNLPGFARASADGRFIAFGGSSLKLLEVATMSVVWVLPIALESDGLYSQHMLSQICFAKDGLTVHISTLREERGETGNGGEAGLSGAGGSRKVPAVSHCFSIDAFQQQTLRHVASVPGLSTGLAVASDNRTLLLSTLDGAVHTMDSFSTTGVRTQEGGAGILNLCTVGDDQSELALALASGHVVVKASQGGAPLNSSVNPAQQPAAITASCMSPDGNFLCLLEAQYSSSSSLPSLFAQAYVKTQSPSFANLNSILSNARQERSSYNATAQSAAESRISLANSKYSSRHSSAGSVRSQKQGRASTASPSTATPRDSSVTKSIPSDLTSSSQPPKSRSSLQAGSQSSTTAIAVYETSSRRIVACITAPGTHIFVDVERGTRGVADVGALITGTTSGTVHLWNWSSFGELVRTPSGFPRLIWPADSSRTVAAAMEIAVLDRGYWAAGYALHPTQSWIAVAAMEGSLGDTAASVPCCWVSVWDIDAGTPLVRVGDVGVDPARLCFGGGPLTPPRVPVHWGAAAGADPGSAVLVVGAVKFDLTSEHTKSGTTMTATVRERVEQLIQGVVLGGGGIGSGSSAKSRSVTATTQAWDDDGVAPMAVAAGSDIYIVVEDRNALGEAYHRDSSNGSDGDAGNTPTDGMPVITLTIDTLSRAGSAEATSDGRKALGQPATIDAPFQDGSHVEILRHIPHQRIVDVFVLTRENEAPSVAERIAPFHVVVVTSLGTVTLFEVHTNSVGASPYNTKPLLSSPSSVKILAVWHAGAAIVGARIQRIAVDPEAAENLKEHGGEQWNLVLWGRSNSCWIVRTSVSASFD